MRLNLANINECIEGTSIVVLMLCATIPRVPKTVPAYINPDILEMDRLAKGNVTKAPTLIDKKNEWKLKK